jgi:AAA domain
VLDERTVLMVDEAGMLGSRKLARLLDYAADARAKIVLVGDDKQLAAIEAGGGFRGLRLRLGASELSENRRQAEPWEREAVEHLRDGNIDAALHAYREHDRLVATETPGQLKETMLSDWWQSFQQGNRVVILAYRRDEVDQFNTACQQLRDAEGHLGAERLQVRDRSFAVGDQVVCGKNAIKQFGVANATRGQVVALDLEQRSMTLKLDNGRQVTLPRAYLDKRPARWLGNNPDRRTVDLAYATTGHKSQGITRDEVLVRVTSAEDRQWLHAADRERDARQQQQQYQAHREANPDLEECRRELLRVQAWRKRADARAVELLRPEWSRELGERPASVKGGRTWDRAVEQTIEYRQRWDVEDAEHPLGREPHALNASLEQRQAWQHATRAVGRLRDLAGDRTDRVERGDHREATGRSDQKGDHGTATGRSVHEGATSRSDRQGDHRGDQWRDRRQRLLDRERDHGHERAM